MISKNNDFKLLTFMLYLKNNNSSLDVLGSNIEKVYF